MASSNMIQTSFSSSFSTSSVSTSNTNSQVLKCGNITMFKGDVKVALFGAGNVGSGVLDILNKSKDKIKTQTDINFIVDKVYVRDTQNPKYDHIDEKLKVTDYNVILNDPSIKLIIETMGGTTFSDTIITGALEKGKMVVSANKDLLFLKLDKYIELCNKHGGCIGLEAAVCGGIPIINTLLNCMQSDNIKTCSGIMNGTTNFILSKMETTNKNLNEMIIEAQEKGYAEPDPTSDVEGYDIKYKIGILAKIIYGMKVTNEEIWSQGITKITRDDFKYAEMLNSTIKMIALLEKNNDKVKIIVSPMIVSKKYIEANVKGATNMVFLNSDNLTEQLLIGEGAGKFPTANSVVSDVINLSSGKTYHNGIIKNLLDVDNEWKSKFYIRFHAYDHIGLINNISKMCVDNMISINSILQLPIEDPKNIVFVLITDTCSIRNIKKLMEDIELRKNDFVASEFFLKVDPFYMPIYER